MPEPRVAILLVNWNGWNDTLECLESIFRLDYPNFVVVVCDNASDDGSMERIREWLAGASSFARASDHRRGQTSGEIERRVPFVELTRMEAEAGKSAAPAARVVLIQNG